MEAYILHQHLIGKVAEFHMRKFHISAESGLLATLFLLCLDLRIKQQEDTICCRQARLYLIQHGRKRVDGAGNILSIKQERQKRTNCQHTVHRHHTADHADRDKHQVVQECGDGLDQSGPRP